MHVRADLAHHARRLVAEDHRLLHHEGADAAMGVVVHVAAADPDRPQRDAHVTRPELLFERYDAKRQAVLLLENECFHALLLLIRVIR